MNVASIMSQRLVTVEMDDNLKMVKEIFDNTRFHHLLVTESNKLFGIISDRDLLKAISPNIGTLNASVSDEATLKKRAHQIMTRKPITISERADIYDAIDIFTRENISCIPVVAAEGRPIGMLSWRDVMLAVSAKRQSMA